MTPVLIYILPTAKHGQKHFHYGCRFVRTFKENPPDYDYRLYVVSNGGPPSGKAVVQFSWLRGRFIEHDDSGMDIGAYQLVARSIASEMMVFFGGSSYFRKPGWLKRMVEVFNQERGDLYGCTGNQGVGNIFPHIRTTGFWCDPKLLSEHPMRVTQNSQRYPYEHGPHGLTSWMLATGRDAWVVGWDTARPLHDCNSLPGGLHNGTQHNLIVGDRLTEPPYYHAP